MLNFFFKLWRIVSYITKQYVEDNCSSTAASLSYSTLLSIVPLLLVMFSIAAQIPQIMQTVSDMEQFFLQNFISNTASSVGTYFDNFLRQVNQLSWTHIVAFTVTALILLYNMVHAFNLVWGVKMDWERRFTMRFLLHFAILLMAPLLLGFLAILISYVASLSFVENKDFHQIIVSPLIFSMPYLVALVTFTFLNSVLPTCKVNFRSALLAGFTTTVCFEVLKYVFSLYIRFFPTYQLIYGAVAVIPIFIIWVYLTWVLILLGAIFCKGLQDDFDDQETHSAFI